MFQGVFFINKGVDYERAYYHLSLLIQYYASKRTYAESDSHYL